MQSTGFFLITAVWTKSKRIWIFCSRQIRECSALHCSTTLLWRCIKRYRKPISVITKDGHEIVRIRQTLWLTIIARPMDFCPMIILMWSDQQPEVPAPTQMPWLTSGATNLVFYDLMPLHSIQSAARAEHCSGWQQPQMPKEAKTSKATNQTWWHYMLK